MLKAAQIMPKAVLFIPVLFAALGCETRVIEKVVIVEKEVVRLVEVPKVIEVCRTETPAVAAGDRTRAQGVKLARWCVTEDACVLWPEGKGSLEHPDCGTDGELSEDCKAIVEVMEHNRKRSHRTWDDTLAFMSPRVMGDKEPRPGTRQRWLKTLPAEGFEQPTDWRDCREEKPCDGDWRLYDERWAFLREAMVEWWLTGPHDVCPGKPLAEGTVEDAEQIAIPKRGFVRYDCGERLWIGGPPLPEEVASL